MKQIGPTEDDVALLWLADSSRLTLLPRSDALENASPALPLADNIAGIGEIFSGPSIALYYNAGDSRAPDILVTPNIGVTYSNSTKKLAEHGGFAHDDTNVILLVSNPDFRANTVTTPVQTKQVAPTILEALGLNPQSLKAVRLEHTPVLPGLPIPIRHARKGGGGQTLPQTRRASRISGAPAAHFPARANGFVPARRINIINLESEFRL